MEIYTNTQPTLTLDITTDNNPNVTPDATPTVQIFDLEDVLVETGTVAGGLGESYSTDFPVYLTDEVKSFKVKWSYVVDGHPLTRTVYVDIVEPLLTINELRNVNDTTLAMSDEDLTLLERRVRSTIVDATAQTFGHEEKTISVIGQGTDTLVLPERIYRLDTVNYQWFGESDNYNLLDYGVILGDDNYSLSYSSTALLGGTMTFTTPGVITAPPINNLFSQPFFEEDTIYVVHGVFGWESVPADIKLAAQLLADDYSCGEDKYRQKRLNSVNSGNWRIDFQPGAFIGTGNADVDRILAGYVNNGMAVI